MEGIQLKSKIASQNVSRSGSLENENAERLTRHFNTDDGITIDNTSKRATSTPSNIPSSAVNTQDINLGADMSKNGYIKLSREAHELLHQYPLAFLVLTDIVMQVKRCETRFNKHIPMLVTEYKQNCFEKTPYGRGYSRREVRTAIDFLTEENFIEKTNLVQTLFETRQKRSSETATKKASESTTNKLYVKLLDKSIYDVNEVYEQPPKRPANQPLNGPVAGQQQDNNKKKNKRYHNNKRNKEIYSLSNDKEIYANLSSASISLTSDNLYIEEKNVNLENNTAKLVEDKNKSKENKKLKSKKVTQKRTSIFATGEKLHLGRNFQCVELHEGELIEMRTRFGASQTEELIESLDAYIANGKGNYQNHFATLINWQKKSQNSQNKEINNYGSSRKPSFNQQDPISRSREEFRTMASRAGSNL